MSTGGREENVRPGWNVRKVLTCCCPLGCREHWQQYTANYLVRTFYFVRNALRTNHNALRRALVRTTYLSIRVCWIQTCLEPPSIQMLDGQDPASPSLFLLYISLTLGARQLGTSEERITLRSMFSFLFSFFPLRKGI